MKKLQISDKESIRFDGLRYNLTDLFRLTSMSGIRLDPWHWAMSNARTRDISRRGWFIKKYWAKDTVLIDYAHYLSPALYREVLSALNLDDPLKVIALFGEIKAARIDPRAAAYLTERNEKRKREAIRLTEQTLRIMRDAGAKRSDGPYFNADDLPKPAKRKEPARPSTRSVSHSRSMGPSVQDHRSEPDFLTSALMYNAVSSSHSSSSSCSWSGDSGSDSGGGGCSD